MSEWTGPDRRAQTMALAEAVLSLDDQVEAQTTEVRMLRHEVATERRWRRLVVAVVALLAPLVIGVGVAVTQNRQTIRILTRVTGPEAQQMQAEQLHRITCDLKADLRRAVGAAPPDGC
jgi:hypothetical protein